jgi:hypothetical protein
MIVEQLSRFYFFRPTFQNPPFFRVSKSSHPHSQYIDKFFKNYYTSASLYI